MTAKTYGYRSKTVLQNRPAGVGWPRSGNGVTLPPHRGRIAVTAAV